MTMTNLTFAAILAGIYRVGAGTLLCAVLAPSSFGAGAQELRPDPLANGFMLPPVETKPWCYWYWINDHISREGISKDLAAMNRVGIDAAFLGNISLDNQPSDSVKVLSPELWNMVAHAMQEGVRTGVDIGLVNCPGWSQSGGPWIKPEESMRRLAVAELSRC